MFELHPQLEVDCFQLGDFPLSRVLLMNDSRYPWLILVPRKQGISEQFELTVSEQQQLISESSLLAKILMQLFNGDKMNIAALGNVVSQLHIHHVVRFKNDETWPAPVWGKGIAVAYGNEEVDKVISMIVSALSVLQTNSLEDHNNKLGLELDVSFEALNYSVNDYK